MCTSLLITILGLYGFLITLISVTMKSHVKNLQEQIDELQRLALDDYE